ncbi:Uncharacterized protein DBV15_11738 [Temnothorax longispinosus]|uniref:Leukotriene A-4 hydrolase n=1 Tax=Temnothorax longispinosus TaxID=300112 RepID=A0A4S2L2R2_9HYME|nr:Uncharacterized protein DBV15_11738 [Temnothorax longispinosus]
MDFNRNVLKGKAILTIERKPPIRTIVNIFGLTISRVTKINGTRLKYYVGKRHADGSPFYIELPQLQTVDTTYNSNFECKIQIKYETSPNSSALYWLTPTQTADGLYSFLFSNKLIYARAWFPSQDTPSVKSIHILLRFLYQKIRVLMSALLENTFKGQQLDIYEFRQMTPISSYAVIAMDSLEKKNLFIGPMYSPKTNTLKNVSKRFVHT